MEFEPRHPDEPALHHQLRDALNGRLTNTDFLVWINVEPTGRGRSFEHLDAIVEQADAWLTEQDPDQEPVLPEDLPERSFSDPAARVRIRALPKKREARGTPSREIVGNPEPILMGWS